VKGSCGILSTGEVRCFDMSDTPNPAQIPGITDATQISGDRSRGCAVRSNGSIACWGGFAEDLSSIASRGPFAEVSVSTSQSCARTVAGELWCWGMAPVGVFRSIVNLIPVRIALDGVASVAVSRYHVCASTSSGSVYCWGDASLGRLGVPAYGWPWEPGPGKPLLALDHARTAAPQAGG
jgi:hypothetical protein